MTRKHFEAIASILSDNRFEGGRKEAVRSIARDLADYFDDVNPYFDRERFLAASGVADD